MQYVVANDGTDHTLAQLTLQLSGEGPLKARAAVGLCVLQGPCCRARCLAPPARAEGWGGIPHAAGSAVRHCALPNTQNSVRFLAGCRGPCTAGRVLRRGGPPASGGARRVRGAPLALRRRGAGQVLGGGGAVPGAARGGPCGAAGCAVVGAGRDCTQATVLAGRQRLSARSARAGSTERCALVCLALPRCRRTGTTTAAPAPASGGWARLCRWGPPAWGGKYAWHALASRSPGRHRF